MHHNIFRFLSPSSNDQRSKKTRRRELWGDPVLGCQSVRMTCPNCRHCIKTSVVLRHTWRSIAAMFGLCFVPELYRVYQYGLHYCSLCRSYLGRTKYHG